jgi:hypothetical protein
MFMKNQHLPEANNGRGPRRAVRRSELKRHLARLWDELHPQVPPIGHPIPRLTVPPVPELSPKPESRRPKEGRIPRSEARTTLLRVRVPTGCLGGKRVSEENRVTTARDRFRPQLAILIPLCSVLVILVTGCQVLTYTGPNGERFMRSSLGANTSIAALSVEADTNGVRRVTMQGYQNESTQALSTVTEAVVRAAIHAPK